MDLRVFAVGQCLGFVIGAQLGLGLTAVAVDLGLFNGMSNEARHGFCIIGALVGGFIGALEGYVTDGWTSLGRFREPAFGVAAGCILGVMAGIVYTAVITRDPRQMVVIFTGEYRNFPWYNNPARLRHFCTLVGLSAGVVLGGVAGAIAGRMRRAR